MKKKLCMMSVLFMALLVLTGCGGKKLTCTLTEDGGTAKAITNFKDDKATTTTISAIEEYETEEAAAQSKELYDGFKAFITQEYMTMDIKQSGKKVTVDMTLDFTKMTDEQITEETELTDISYDSMKSYYEAQGYSCK